MSKTPKIQNTRILVAAEWFPPAYRAGGPVSSVANLVEALSTLEEGVEFFILAGAYDLGGEEEMEGVEIGVWQQQSPQIQVRYEKEAGWGKSSWKSLISDLKPDVLYLNSLFSVPFSLRPLRIARKMGIKIVLAPRGMLGDGALAIKPLKKYVFLSLARVLEFFREVNWHVSTEEEAEKVKMHIPGAKIFIAKNFPNPKLKRFPVVGEDSAWQMLVLGRVHPIKNTHFALQVLSSMDLPERGICVEIVGPAEDEEYLRELLKLSKGRLKVINVGPLPPSKLEPVFAKAHYLLMPTTHENYGHAVVESWGYGRPVLLSDNTPWKGLEKAKLGWDVPLVEALWKEAFEKAFELTGAELEDQSLACRKRYEMLLSDPILLASNRALFQK